MARTTVDIDGPILEELRQLKRRERKSMGRLVSELLAAALRARRKRDEPAAFEWIAKDLGARYDVGDKERLWRDLDREQFGGDEPDPA